MTAPDRKQLLVMLGYDGARFRGVAPQEGQATVSAALKQRFLDAGVYPKGLNFTSRTDAGVHARRNLATCWLKGPPDLDGVIAAVAAPVDDGLRDLRILKVPISVHARSLARGKHYRYLIDDGWGGEAPAGPESWCLGPALDPDAMAVAAAPLVGAHDFASFSARRKPRQQDTRREITAIDIAVVAPRDAPHGAPGAAAGAAPRGPGKRIVIDVVGKSFLRQMVRIIVGTLAEVGAGLRPPEAMAAALAARQRSAAGLVAPAWGLTLMDILCAWTDPPVVDEG